MNERKEKVKQSRVAFFDADKTLWQVISKDPIQDNWASKGITRTFTLEAPNQAVRAEDETRFVLKGGVIDTLQTLAKEGIIVGIISDNIYEDVETVSQLLGIWQYFDKGFVNVRLWKGPADKNLMISEILSPSEAPKVLKFYWLTIVKDILLRCQNPDITLFFLQKILFLRI